MTDDPKLRFEAMCDGCGVARAKVLVLTHTGGQLQLCAHHAAAHRAALATADAVLTDREQHRPDPGQPQRVAPGSRYRDRVFRQVDPEMDSDD